MKQRSLFDVISPIMTGPSSSHTAGAVRLGMLARSIYKNIPQRIIFKLYNSFAETGRGHGTDKGLLAGFLGYGVDSENIKKIFTIQEAKKTDYSFEYEQNIDRHPNSVDFILEGSLNMTISGNSIGAGNVEIIKIDDFTSKISGEFNTLLLFYKDKPGMISKVSTLIQQENINIASLDCDRDARGQTASMCICLDSEISKQIIQKIEEIDDVYFVRSIKKLEA
ncbi:MAG: L-serine ammonia-lyase, iron-sulfur-dependent subunit beta [Candidatus Gastranaerophilales bacterium]|nr:L-serine ammonia-lyase, iron-sulfur-dependent subunit beta [Candidatus Gastranaerophilales bacterium]